ncbi:MAG: Aldo/keto reductase, partial [uncultured bacterium]
MQVIYNIFDQSPEEKLYPLCQKMGVAVIARVPFDEGSLTGTLTPETEFNKKDWRRMYFTPDRLAETCRRLEPLKEIANKEKISLPLLALKYCLAHPAVTTVIPGMKSTTHIEENVQASDGKSLSEQVLSELKNHKWLR